MLVKFVKEYEVSNLSQLKMKASVSKHVEQSYISFYFSDNFKIEYMSDDVIINMLDNIENRL